jgi:hypothetical protein
MTTYNAGNLTSNTNYQVTLSQKGGDTVVGNSPQDFEFSLLNEYTSLLTLVGQVSSDIPLGNIASAVVKGAVMGATIFGVGAPIAASVQVWTGTNPMEFTLPISFRAYSDPQKDVINPLRTLIQMASPTRIMSAFMQAPGPTLADAGINLANVGSVLSNNSKSGSTGSSFLTNLNKGITMQIGTGIIVPGLVITGLNIKVANRAYRKNGLPTFAEATVSLRTFVSYCQDDVLGMFYEKSSTTASSSSSGSAAGTGAGGGS